MIRFEKAIQELLEAIPELPEEYVDPAWVEEDLAYPIYGVGGFASFVTKLLRSPVRDEGLLRKCFSFVEELAISLDKDTRDLVYVGFLESLGEPRLDKDFISLARRYMGPETLQMYEPIYAMYGA
jgi:hypothetical protein